MSSSAWTRNLNDVLADLYPTVDDSKRIVQCAEMRSALVKYNASALVNWFNIIEEAGRQGGKERALLECALADYPEHKILVALKRDEPPDVRGPDLTWKAPDDAEHLEKITGAQSTLLPISFLEVGMQRARAVARVVRADRASGTGFLIGKGWLLTNNHVLPSAAAAAGAVAEFNYQLNANGLAAPVTTHQLDATRFFTSQANDWSAIGIAPEAEDEWGKISLQPKQARVDDFVNIIQHPGGGAKHIALYHNTVTYVGEGRVQYLTDTLPGSSGAPVFNDQWQVVALHHSGGMLREPGTKQFFYRNEGIDTVILVADLRKAGVLDA